MKASEVLKITKKYLKNTFISMENWFTVFFFLQ